MNVPLKKSKAAAQEPQTAWDECYLALKEIKDLAHVPNEHSVALRDTCHRMRAAIGRMLAYAPQRENAQGLQNLNERMARVIELANMQECGSLQIEINREMDAAWKRMP